MTETTTDTTIDESLAKGIAKDFAVSVAQTAAGAVLAVAALTATGAIINWRQNRQAKKAAQEEQK